MSAIFLVGFMASGKSCVAEQLAEELGRPWMDLDEEIERREGLSVAEIFEERGEEGFRVAESRALRELAKGEMIVATGGGTPCHGDNFEVLRSRGQVIHLATSLEVALARVKDPTTRPLLAKGEVEIRSLYERRQRVYRQAHWNISTDHRTPGALAVLIADCIRASEWLPEERWPQASAVALGSRSYPILCERGLLGRTGEMLRAARPESTKVGLLTDANVGPLYGDRCCASLESAGFEVEAFQVESGERAKSMDVFARLCEEMVARGLDRKSVIVALGGGVVGDLGGFVASALFRGIPVLHLPTTLVAMTDSAIGGKTAVNTAHGKNLVGAFWQPMAVLSDPDVLATLPPRERRSAFGELVKYALLDGAMLPCIESVSAAMADEVLKIDDELCDVLRRCAALKAAVVSMDEREAGLRATLNLGHTVGHAIEAAAGYGTVLHGEAVALGLLATCRISSALGLCAPELEARVEAILGRAGLDTDLDPWLRPEVLDKIGVDKKRTGSRVAFIALSEPGQVRVCPLAVSEIKELLGRDRPTDV